MCWGFLKFHPTSYIHVDVVQLHLANEKIGLIVMGTYLLGIARMSSGLTKMHLCCRCWRRVAGSSRTYRQRSGSALMDGWMDGWARCRFVTTDGSTWIPFERGRGQHRPIAGWSWFAWILVPAVHMPPKVCRPDRGYWGGAPTARSPDPRASWPLLPDT